MGIGKAYLEIEKLANALWNTLSEEEKKDKQVQARQEAWRNGLKAIVEALAEPEISEEKKAEIKAMSEAQEEKDKPITQLEVGDIVKWIEEDRIGKIESIFKIQEKDVAWVEFNCWGNPRGDFLVISLSKLTLLFSSSKLPTELDGYKVGDVVEFEWGSTTRVGEITHILERDIPFGITYWDNSEFVFTTIRPEQIKKKLWPAEKP